MRRVVRRTSRAHDIKLSSAVPPPSPRAMAAGNRSIARAVTAGSDVGDVVRREIATTWGVFSDKVYKPFEDGVRQGVDMLLEFTPGEKVDSPKVGMTRAILTEKEGKLDKGELIDALRDH